MHLRPLALVIDTGWNLNVAVENIEKIVKGLVLLGAVTVDVISKRKKG